MREFPKARTTEGLQRDIYTVERLNKSARALLESAFPQVWVEGEVSNLSAPASGHLYFTLKDDSAQVRCAWFRNRRALLDYAPADGEHVLIRARMTVYEPRGDFQLVVQYVEPAGEGALRMQFERLKRSLQAEGLFEPTRKKALPRIPTCVGVITSPSGAAVRDVITTCGRRFPAAPLVIYPTPVQGDQAVDGILRALALAQRRSECDVLILTRGGGTLEDLMAFNDERVARAIAEVSIPLITGIGHETDVTIADFVADQRAPTPTAAAEMTLPDAGLLLRRLDTVRARLLTCIGRRIEKEAQRSDLYAHRLIHPARRCADARRRLELLSGRLGNAMQQATAVRTDRLAECSRSLIRHGPRGRIQSAAFRLQRSGLRFTAAAKRITAPMRQRLGVSTGKLDTVSPLATLGRGYALVTSRDGHVITDTRQVRRDQCVDVRLARGALVCRVKDLKP